MNMQVYILIYIMLLGMWLAIYIYISSEAADQLHGLQHATTAVVTVQLLLHTLKPHMYMYSG